MPSLNPITNFSYFRLWKEVWPYAEGQRGNIVLYHLMYLFAMVFELSIPWMFGKLVNTLQAAGPGLFDECLKYLGIIIACQFFMWTLHGPGRVIERRAGQAIFISYISKSFRRLTELPLSWHQDHHSGSSINRIRTAANALKGFVENSFISFQRVVMLTGSIIMLCSFNIYIGLVSL
ncbi:MAG: ABC transporter transmembrane domain-containing protein, partial [Alphaproteobacteria bacterium]